VCVYVVVVYLTNSLRKKDFASKMVPTGVRTGSELADPEDVDSLEAMFAATNPQEFKSRKVARKKVCDVPFLFAALSVAEIMGKF